jgi:hypothetical protein
MPSDYRYVQGRGYVANINGKEVVYDRDELPELLKRLESEKKKQTTVSDYEYVQGVGYVAYIDGKKIIFDEGELPKLKELLQKKKEESKEKVSHIQTPEIMDKPEEELSFKEYLAKNIHKYPDLAYIFDKKK